MARIEAGGVSDWATCHGFFEPVRRSGLGHINTGNVDTGNIRTLEVVRMHVQRRCTQRFLITVDQERLYSPQIRQAASVRPHTRRNRHNDIR
jgi:hypothetical protein